MPTTERAVQIAEMRDSRRRQIEHRARIEDLLLDQPNHHGYAVVVKVRDLFCECDHANEIWHGTRACECGYEDVREQFWERAGELAVEHGFRDVYSAGRMGGYCVPQPEPPVEDMYTHELREWERERFGPFAIAIADLLAATREHFAKSRQTAAA